jgi:hypothetical protein
MRISVYLGSAFILMSLVGTAPVVAQKQMAKSPRILSAKTVFFSNQTGSDAVGDKALAELKKWGNFKLCSIQGRLI